LAEGTYGVMVHYLVVPKGNTPEEKTCELNRIVDGFDLDCFMRQFAATRADWLIFTIGQNTGYYNSSNTYLDAHLPGRTPQRDLVYEIALRLAAMKKKFIVYIPGDMACKEEAIRGTFGWEDDDHSEFLNRYQQFVREYSLKFGTLVHGWWFDGCYELVHHNRWDWGQWLRAARAGNPETICAFNDGSFCLGRIQPLTPLEEYHSGEVHLLENGKIRADFLDEKNDIVVVNGTLRTAGREPELYVPDAQFVDGVQWHALVPIDSTFNPAVPEKFCHYSDKDLFSFVMNCKKVKGAVTLNAPIDKNGHIPEETFQQLERLGETISRQYHELS
jgi:hypothetical protein